MARPTKLETENQSLKGTNATLLREVDQLRRYCQARDTEIQPLITRLDMAHIVIVDQATELMKLRRELSISQQTLRVID